MTHLLLVAIGGAVGATLRYLTGLITIRLFRKSKVLTGTVIANSIGCLIAGIILGVVTANGQLNEEIILFLTVGILGSYTTFSTFSLELSRLINESWSNLLTYLFIQVIVAIFLCVAGYICTLWLMGGNFG